MTAQPFHSLAALILLSLLSVHTLARPSVPIPTCTKTVVVNATLNPNETCISFAAANGITLGNLYRWNRGLDSTGRCTNLDDGNAICVSVTPLSNSNLPPGSNTYFTPPPLSPPIPSGASTPPNISPRVDPAPASRTDVPVSVSGTSSPTKPTDLPVASTSVSADPTDVAPQPVSPILSSGWPESSNRLHCAVSVLLSTACTVILLL